jgi:hypothetical protein
MLLMLDGFEEDLWGVESVIPTDVVELVLFGGASGVVSLLTYRRCVYCLYSLVEGVIGIL